MIYLDSNVFLYAIIEKEKEMAGRCSLILSEVASGSLEACTSALTWDEVVWATRKHMNAADAVQKGREFVGFPNMDMIDANRLIISEAQNIMEKHSLKPRDAIHAASALSKGIKQFVSDDPDFDKVPELQRISIEGFASGMKIKS